MVKKNRVLHVRLLEDEYEAYAKLVHGIGETLSRFTRKLIREAINGDIDLLTDEQLLLKAGMRQLVGMAHNLNQLTKLINSGVIPKVLDDDLLQKSRQCALKVREEFAAAVLKTKKRWINHCVP